MARYVVKRPFPAKMPMRSGQIVEDPQWKDLTYLISRGYIAEVGDGADVPDIELKVPIEETPAPVDETNERDPLPPRDELIKMKKADLMRIAREVYGVPKISDDNNRDEIADKIIAFVAQNG